MDAIFNDSHGESFDPDRGEHFSISASRFSAAHSPEERKRKATCTESCYILRLLFVSRPLFPLCFTLACHFLRSLLPNRGFLRRKTIRNRKTLCNVLSIATAYLWIPRVLKSSLKSTSSEAFPTLPRILNFYLDLTFVLEISTDEQSKMLQKIF